MEFRKETRSLTYLRAWQPCFYQLSVVARERLRYSVELLGGNGLYITCGTVRLHPAHIKKSQGQTKSRKGWTEDFGLDEKMYLRTGFVLKLKCKRFIDLNLLTAFPATVGTWRDTVQHCVFGKLAFVRGAVRWRGSGVFTHLCSPYAAWSKQMLRVRAALQVARSCHMSESQMQIESAVPLSWMILHEKKKNTTQPITRSKRISNPQH